MANLTILLANSSIAASPASDGFAITTSNSTTFSGNSIPRSLFIGAAGNVVVQTLSNTTLTFINIPSACILPVKVIRVLTTTTANNIIGLL